VYFFLQAIVLIAAATLDFLLGDPWGWPHPVQGMGWVISRGQGWMLQQWQQPKLQRGAGIVLALVLGFGTGGLTWTIVTFTARIHSALSSALAIVLLASCFAGRSLARAAQDVLIPLAKGQLEQARDRLRLYVGRDTDQLSEAEVLRATLETVTENATDGVLAPLFYAGLGAMLPGIGPVPLAFFYKAISTLDSMIGYREPPYTHIGWFSAKLEDGLTWLPCRLMVLTLAIWSQRPLQVLRICQRDAPADPSPNAGWSECVYAAILGVQLGGLNWYRGVAKSKPLLGDAGEPIAPTHIIQALRLTRICFLLWLLIGCGVLMGLQFQTTGFPNWPLTLHLLQKGY
jgi:adenosylcobinamide-phosphate synthase